ncbi:MAG: hypothetical protein K0041_06420 [Acidithiobacillus sp.]|nr:hypothetical protein [Acidithiobacillus sp.]
MPKSKQVLISTWILALGLATPLWAAPVQKDAQPKPSLEVPSKGFGDPYPAEDQHQRQEAAKLLNDAGRGQNPFKKRVMQYGPATSKSAAEKTFDAMIESFQSCSAIKLPWQSEDLADFPIAPQAMQMEMAAKGMLFAPAFTKKWVMFVPPTLGLLKDGDLPFDINLPVNGRVRVLFFQTTAPTSILRTEFLRQAESLGYEKNRGLEELKKKGAWVSKDFLWLVQPVTPAIANNALISLDEINFDDTDKGEIDPKYDTPKVRAALLHLRDSGPTCVASNDQGKTWLEGALNPKTGKHYTFHDIHYGMIFQFSAMKLGKATEQFTRAHVEDRLKIERKMTPAQIQAYREATQKALAGEGIRQAPEYQKFLNEQAAQMEKGNKEFQQKLTPKDIAKLSADLAKAGADAATVARFRAQFEQLVKDSDQQIPKIAEHMREVAKGNVQ